MAHFAEIDADNIVLRVLVVGDDEEHRGQEFLADDLSLGGTWIQTSYNNNMRFRFAGVGYTYDAALDAFIAPQPYPSWTLDTETADWVPPTPATPGYDWDEDTLSWVQPAQTEPSWVWEGASGWMPPVPYPGIPGEAPFYDWDEDTLSWVQVDDPNA